MTEAVRAPGPGRGAAIAAILVGALTCGFGFLAATAAGMATAPDGGTGLFSMIVMAAGAILVGLGIASLAVARLRPMAKSAAIAYIVGLIGLYIFGQVLIMAGLADG